MKRSLSLFALTPALLVASAHAQLVFAPGPGEAPIVSVREPSGAVRSFTAFDPAFRGGVHVAAGDINGDGLADIFVGAGPGAPGGHVKVFNGSDHGVFRSIHPYGNTYRGGTYVAVGILLGDRTPDIVVSSDQRPEAGPHVRVFDGATGWHLYSLDPFPGFNGGVRVAVADLDGDGFDDIIAAPIRPGTTLTLKTYCGRTMIELPDVIVSSYSVSGHGGDAHVAVIPADFAAGRPSGTILVGMGDGSVRFIKDSIDVGTWRPFGPSYTGGLSVAVGDVDGDGRLEVVAGSLAGGRIASIAVDNSDPSGAATVMEPYGTGFTGGIFVGAPIAPNRCQSADFNRDGDFGTDADIEAFFACLAGNCCNACVGADFNLDGDIGTDADIEAFFRVLGGGGC